MISSQFLSNDPDICRFIIERSMDSIIITDADLNIIYSNTAACELFGYEPEELCGQNPCIFSAADNQKILDNCASGFPFGGQCLNRRKGGSLFCCEYNIFPLKDPDGKIQGYMGSHRDITESKLIQLNLEENDIFYEVANTSPENILLLDTEMNVIWANRTVLSMNPNSIGRKCYFSLLDRSVPCENCPAQKAFETGKFQPAIRHHSFMAGRNEPSCWEGNCVPLRNRDGEIVSVAIISRDITQRVESEKRMRLMEIFVDNSACEFYALDSRGSIVYVNDNACRVLGYTKAELLSMDLSNIAYSLTQSHQREEYWKSLKEKGCIHLETSHITKDGKIYPVEIHSSYLMFEGEEYEVIMAEDRTARQEIEESFMNARQMAEDAKRTKVEFMTNMSHELRTPLNSIIGFSQFLMKYNQADLDDKQLKYVSNIFQSGNRLLNLINDILSLSRIENGTMDLKCIDFDVITAIDETLKISSPMARKKSVTIKTDFQFEHMNITADRDKFQAIVYNLLSNAIKFTPSTGHIQILCSYCSGYLQISISDDGIGIPLEKQQFIFRSFEQIDGSTKRSYGGIGLGLTLVKKYVDMHCGKIRVESQPDIGSTFTFLLPVRGPDKNVSQKTK